MISLAVSGATGRMGQVLGRLIREAPDLEVVGGIAPDGHQVEAPDYPRVVEVADAGPIIQAADALVDFSAPDQLAALLDCHAGALAETALLVGTTGLSGELEAALGDAAAAGPVLVAANFSVGVNLLLGLVEAAARALPEADYDVEVVEAHHRHKEDAPSGTALALGRAAAEGRGRPLADVRRDGRSGRGARSPGEVGFHAIRGGGVAGEHTVHLLGDEETVTLGHRAASREVFARGALRAARWLVDKPAGRYTMAQVLGLANGG